VKKNNIFAAGKQYYIHQSPLSVNQTQFSESFTPKKANQFMKKQALTALLAMLMCTLTAGTNHPAEINEDANVTVSLMNDEMPTMYIGLSTGLNFGGIFALTGDFRLSEKATIAPSLGLGSWGYKLGFDFRFYRNHPVGRFFSAGVSRATGLPDPLELDMETTGSSGTQKVSVLYNPVTNLNLGMGYAWKMGARSRFVLDFGYALKVSAGDGYKVTSGHTLTDTSKMAMVIARPGGLRLGLGFHFGF
jgi:hypothetical protein